MSDTRTAELLFRWIRTGLDFPWFMPRVSRSESGLVRIDSDSLEAAGDTVEADTLAEAVALFDDQACDEASYMQQDHEE